MNFSYGIIAAVGILIAISIGFIATSPDDIIEPRVIPVEEESVICTMEYSPVCGVDGKTYENMCILDTSDVALDYDGECVIVEPEASSSSSEPSPTESSSAASIISIPDGVGVPGCEETDECYLPYETTVSVGTTITWSNDDTAAHTVTSGNAAEGHDGLFDSSLFMSDSTYEFTFDESGTYDYFCMVHPWMTGRVIVTEIEEMSTVSESLEITEPEASSSSSSEPSPTESSSAASIISIPDGVGVPGCEETDECYLPYETTVSVGTTITWSNDDTAAHTVTSGTVEAGVTGIFDSGLFMSDSTYEFTFDESGTYDYFCMVHPWMTGIINVN